MVTETQPGAQDAQEQASGEKTISPLLALWKQKMDKLAELQEWLRRAEKEVPGIPKPDPRYEVYLNVCRAAIGLEKEIEEIEEKQDQALTRHLAGTGPLTLEFGDGSRCVVAATTRTAGGPADLLPADLLRVWRVATVFEGSVVGHDAKPTKLTFGDAQQIEWFKPKKGRR